MSSSFFDGGEIRRIRLGPPEFVDHMEELDDTPKWWCVTRGRLIYLAHAISSDGAHEVVAAELGISVDDFRLVPVFTELGDPAAQSEVEEKHKGRRAIRVLQSSIIEWPADLDNLNAEQRQHGIERGWLNPDGTWPEE